MNNDSSSQDHVQTVSRQRLISSYPRITISEENSQDESRRLSTRHFSQLQPKLMALLKPSSYSNSHHKSMYQQEYVLNNEQGRDSLSEWRGHEPELKHIEIVLVQRISESHDM